MPSSINWGTIVQTDGQIDRKKDKYSIVIDYVPLCTLTIFKP